MLVRIARLTVLVGSVLGALMLVGINPHIGFLEKGGIAYEIFNIGSAVLYVLTALLAIFLNAHWDRSTGWYAGAFLLPFIGPIILACLGEPSKAQHWGGGVGTNSSKPYWACPNCNTVMEKRSSDVASFYSSNAVVAGTVSCGECGSTFSRQKVYGGMYDIQ